MRWLPPSELVKLAETLRSDGFCPTPQTIFAEHSSLLLPPENVSTTECAERYRYIRETEGDGKRLWSRDLTPYNVGPQDALDRPDVGQVIMPKPGRSGGTVVAENFAFKLMRFGPMPDIGWYLGSDAEVKSYCDKQVTPLFEDHPEIAAKIGDGPSDNNITSKRVAGRSVEWLPANNKTVTGRQFGFMVGDEIDTFTPRMCASFLQQVRIRQRVLGSRGKAFMASHPDRGWQTGIASAWALSTRGIYVMACAECHHWATPYPTKHWPDVPEFTLYYAKDSQATPDKRIAMAQDTASMLCPHCGSTLDDEQRKSMVDKGQWMHVGQTLDAIKGIVGDVTANRAWGFWIHGLMSKMITNAELAGELEAAKIKFEQTGKADQLREVTAKVFGEVFEGGGLSAKGLSKQRLSKRVAEPDGGELSRRYRLGTVPSWVRYLTAAVDVGGNKFDVGVKGWGENSESCWIDRYTLVAGSDGQSLSPGTRQADWLLLRDKVIERIYPFANDPMIGLMVASTAIDTGGVPGVTHKAREFVRQMKLAGFDGVNQYRIRLIKGAASKKAPEVAPGRAVNKDDEGKAIEPAVIEHTLGVHELKKVIADRLAIDAPGPGYVHFPANFEDRWLTELTNARLVEDVWEETKPNETWDLAVYNEAVRQLLGPDRKEIDWSGKRPPWARPISLLIKDEGEPEPAAPQPKPKSMFERFQSLNGD